MMPPARLLVEEFGSAYVQYSFRSQLVFRCGARPTVNEIRQTDFFFLKPVAVSAVDPFRLVATASGCANCPLGIGVILANGAPALHFTLNQYTFTINGRKRVSRGVISQKTSGQPAPQVPPFSEYKA